MSRPIAIWSSDWHLEPFAWVKHPNLCGDSYFSLNQIVDYSIENKLPLYGAGDLFDIDRPDTNSIKVAFECLDRLKHANQGFFFIQGQHEYARPPWLSLHDWAQHVDNQKFYLGDIVGYGLDFVRGKDECKASLRKIPKDTDVLMCHQVWLDLMGIRAGPEAALADVPFASVVLSGDFHRHTTVKAVGATGQPLKLFSPGSICLQSISEEPDKQFYVMNDDLSFKSIPLVCRKVFDFKLHTREELLLFQKNALEIMLDRTSGLPEIIRKPICNVEFDENLAEAYERIIKALDNKVHLFWSMKRKGKLLERPNSIPKFDASKSGIEVCLGELCKPDSMTHKMVSMLIDARNPAELLDTLTETELKEVDDETNRTGAVQLL